MVSARYGSAVAVTRELLEEFEAANEEPPDLVGWFAKPAATGAGDGTSWANAMSLTTAIGGSSPAQPGDTVWLSGVDGDYTGAHTVTVNGTSADPIIFRCTSWTDHPKIDSTGAGSEDARMFIINGDYTWWWGIEFTQSDADSNPFGQGGVNAFGIDTKLIECWVHKTGGNGVGWWRDTENSELVGCVIVDCGRTSYSVTPHGVYTQGDTGDLKTVRANAIIDCDVDGNGFDFHAYSQGGTVNGYFLKDNVMANHVAATSKGELLIGSELSGSDDITIRDNIFWSPQDETHAGGTYGLRLNYFGDTDQGGRLFFDGNYCSEGSLIADLKDWAWAQLTHNTMFGSNQGLFSGKFITGDDLVAPGNQSGFTIDSNTYYDHFDTTPSAGRFHSNGADLSWSGWQAAGWDPNSTLSYVTAPPNVTFVKPSPAPYTEGRAIVTILNYDGDATVDVNCIDARLGIGDTYDIFDYTDLNTPLDSGVYDGTALTFTTPDEFNCFVIVPTGLDLTSFLIANDEGMVPDRRDVSDAVVAAGVLGTVTSATGGFVDGVDEGMTIALYQMLFVDDATITASSTSLTSASGAFPSWIVAGMPISVPKAGIGGVTHYTTVASRTNANTLVLTNAAVSNNGGWGAEIAAGHLTTISNVVDPNTATLTSPAPYAFSAAQCSWGTNNLSSGNALGVQAMTANKNVYCEGHYLWVPGTSSKLFGDLTAYEPNFTVRGANRSTTSFLGVSGSRQESSCAIGYSREGTQVTLQDFAYGYLGQVTNFARQCCWDLTRRGTTMMYARHLRVDTLTGYEPSAATCVRAAEGEADTYCHYDSCNLPTKGISINLFANVGSYAELTDQNCVWHSTSRAGSTESDNSYGGMLGYVHPIVGRRSINSTYDVDMPYPGNPFYTQHHWGQDTVLFAPFCEYIDCEFLGIKGRGLWLRPELDYVKILRCTFHGTTIAQAYPSVDYIDCTWAATAIEGGRGSAAKTYRLIRPTFELGACETPDNNNPGYAFVVDFAGATVLIDDMHLDKEGSTTCSFHATLASLTANNVTWKVSLFGMTFGGSNLDSHGIAKLQHFTMLGSVNPSYPGLQVGTATSPGLVHLFDFDSSALSGRFMTDVLGTGTNNKLREYDNNAYGSSVYFTNGRTGRQTGLAAASFPVGS